MARREGGDDSSGPSPEDDADNPALRPAAMRPAVLEPGAMRPAVLDPGAKRPAVRPAVLEPGAKRPAVRPAVLEPGAMRPAVLRPGAPLDQLPEVLEGVRATDEPEEPLLGPFDNVIELPPPHLELYDGELELDVPGREKYVLLEAPNFNGAADPAEQMSSYLRLGAVADPRIAGNENADPRTGEDLAALVQGFADDVRKRHDDDNFSEGYVPPEERLAETALLHHKGGWRDHSDGNRITTTRGDKVEVIRGNYRMVVLGRRNDDEHEAGWDISGGHVNESSITSEGREGSPLGESRIEWVKNHDGTWRIVEHTSKGDVYSTFHGDTYDWYWGKRKESTTGSEKPEPGRENPIIVDRTWARTMESHSGSEALPIESTHDVSHVRNISSVTRADRISDDTRANIITSSTIADEVRSYTRGNVSDVTRGNSESEIWGNEKEMITGTMTEITLGAETSITCGLVTDITLAAMIELCVALKLEMDFGLSVEINADKKILLAPVELDFKPTKYEFSLAKMTYAALHMLS